MQQWSVFGAHPCKLIKRHRWPVMSVQQYSEINSWWAISDSWDLQASFTLVFEVHSEESQNFWPGLFGCWSSVLVHEIRWNFVGNALPRLSQGQRCWGICIHGSGESGRASILIALMRIIKALHSPLLLVHITWERFVMEMSHIPSFSLIWSYFTGLWCWKHSV